MRLLKFNGSVVDIDDTTAIGIDFQGYDISEPGSRKVAASNKFTIPRTANNMRIIGFAGNPQSLSLTVYGSMSCEYWNQNKCLIRNGTARVTEVGDRISVFAFEKSTIWTDMQELYWPDFQEELIAWLQTEKDLPSAADPFVGTFADFIEPYIDSTEGVILPFYISNLALYDPAGGTSYIENSGDLYLKYNNTVGGTNIKAHGGHLCVFVKTIFEFIESKYSVDLSVLDETIDYNLFEDAIVSLMYTPIRNLSIQHTSDGFYFLYDDQSAFYPEETIFDKQDKTLYDFTKAFFQHFGVLIDQVPSLNGTAKYIIRRFDDLVNAPIVDLSGKISGIPVFSPTIENYNQNNFITFASVYEGGDRLTNSKRIVCKNKNLDAGSADDSLFEIDCYIPGGIVAGGSTLMNLSTAESLESFVFFGSSGQASTTVYSMQEGVEYSTPVILHIAQLYSLANEYNVLADMVEYPVYYKLKRRLSLLEVDNLAYFARYYIRELNGYFFLNKISGYNPEKSNEPTQLEIIKIPV